MSDKRVFPWIDTETDGVDVFDRKSRTWNTVSLLELAVVFVDQDLNVIDVPGPKKFLFPDDRHPDHELDDYIKELHGSEGTGLLNDLDKASAGESIEGFWIGSHADADAELEAQLLEARRLIDADMDRRSRLGGSNAAFDLRRVHENLPLLSNQLSYNVLDVSSQRESMETFVGQGRSIGKWDTVHRAHEDILDHLEEFKEYVSNIKKWREAHVRSETNSLTF